MHDLLAEHARDSLACLEAGSEAADAYRRLLEHYTERLSAEPVDHRWINEEPPRCWRACSCPPPRTPSSDAR